MASYGSRKRRRSAGEENNLISSGTLPRTQERVLQAMQGPWSDYGPDRAVYQGELGRARRRPVLTASVAKPQGGSATARARVYVARAVRVLARSPSRPIGSLLGQIAQRLPMTTRFCVQRKQRREVMFALDVAGRRGVGAGKRWKRRVESQYNCGGR